MRKTDLIRICETTPDCDSNCERCEVYANYQNTKESRTRVSQCNKNYEFIIEE